MHHHQNGSGLAWSKCFQKLSDQKQLHKTETLDQNHRISGTPEGGTSNQSHKRTGWCGKYMRVPPPLIPWNAPLQVLSYLVVPMYRMQLMTPSSSWAYQPFPCSRRYQSIKCKQFWKKLQQINVIIIATVMSFHLCWVSNFNDTFPPKSCHFLTRIPCPSSESAINRWTSESWKFRNAQFGEAQWMELLLTQFI